MTLLVPPDPNQVTVVLPPELLAVIRERAAKKKPPWTVEQYVTHALQQYTK